MMSEHDVLMMPGPSRVEVFTGTHRRRRWSDEQKAAIVAESYGTSVGEASARYGVSKAQLFNWRREAREPGVALTFAQVAVEAEQPASIEVAARGVLVRIRPGADPSVVTAIIGVLSAGRP